MRIRVMSANLYHDNPRIKADLQLIKDQHCHLVGFGEAYNFIGELKAVDGYTLYKAKPDGRGPQDVPLWVRQGQGIEVTDHGARRLSSPSEPIEIAPARWCVWVEFKYAGHKYFYLNTHVNAALQDDQGRAMTWLDRVQQARKQMAKIEEMIKERRDKGFRIIVTGDFNYRRYPGVRDFKLWVWSPQLVFWRQKMRYVSSVIDYIGFSREMYSAYLHKIGPDKTGSDHHWLVATLKEK